MTLWSESRSTVILAEAALAHARSVAGKEDSQVVQQFEREVRELESSQSAAVFCAVAIVLLSFASVLVMWLPPREEEANQALEPTPPNRPAHL